MEFFINFGFAIVTVANCRWTIAMLSTLDFILHAFVHLCKTTLCFMSWIETKRFEHCACKHMLNYVGPHNLSVCDEKQSLEEYYMNTFSKLFHIYKQFRSIDTFHTHNFWNSKNRRIFTPPFYECKFLRKRFDIFSMENLPAED